MNYKVEGKLIVVWGGESFEVVLIIRLRNNEGLFWNFFVRIVTKLKM